MTESNGRVNGIRIPWKAIVLIRNETRQIGSNLRKDHKKKSKYNEGHQKRHNPPEYVLKGDIGRNAFDHEDVYPHWRRDHPHLAYEYNDDSKPDRIKTELLN